MDTRNLRASSRLAAPASAATPARGFRCAMSGADAESGDAGPIGGPAVFPNSGRNSKPQLQRKVEPEYSEAGRAARVKGVVVLQITIDARGSVTDPKVLTSLGLG